MERCFICGRIANLEKHHCLHGTANRKKAEQDKLYVKICPECHRGTNGVHGKNGHDLDEYLKQRAEKKYLDAGHTIEEFIQRYGKNYL